MNRQERLKVVINMQPRPEPNIFKRTCLRCPRQFYADNKFRRLCDHCTQHASTVGMDEHTHYYGEGVVGE